MYNSIFIFLLFMLNVWQAQAQTINITGPAGSGQFGQTVTVLTNGNYVVTDPLYDDGAITDVGAVYLYNGSTHTLISTLKGSTVNDNIGSAGIYKSIIVLNNGNYLVLSPYWDNGAVTDAGAVTWCNANTGVSGVVSSGNSLVGSSTGDFSNYTLTILNNGNYLVRCSNWDNGSTTDAGAVTWGSAISGVSGIISNSNSLVGSSTGDFSNNTLTTLSNGNYVVLNKYWDNGTATDAGAVTWGNGSVGISGVISSGNSLVGNTADDQVGYGITPLNNDNFVVRSPGWDNGAVTNAGAATWISGNVGLLGEVSGSNSLVGSSMNDSVGGRGIISLSNGNYVVCSSSWDNGALLNMGAVTWGNGITGITGAISNSNSLTGSIANDYVGVSVTALSNGNYVVCSPGWDNGAVANVGAATWGNGTTGITGAISNSNSLTGSTANDYVASSVTALTNGNYVVVSSNWRNGTLSYGAVTWGNGTIGKTGVVSSINSLVGDNIASGGITILNNGNYLVRSPGWDSQFFIDEGAVTWGNGNTGVSGTISSSNSLVGGQPNYRAGDIVTVLSNSNYVVTIPHWSSVAHYAGAVIWCNGATGVSAGALLGSTQFDGIGNQVFPLSNGNYVVVSLYWDNGTNIDAGAVTFGNGTTGTSGAISSSNSLVGTRGYETIGSGGIKVLGNGNYIVQSPAWSNYWSNYFGYSSWTTSAGAVTWGNGLTGTTGSINSSNSLIGSTTDDRVGSGGVTVVGNGDYYVVASPFWNNGVITDPGAITLGNSAGGVAGIITSCNSFTGSTAGGGSSLYFAYDGFYDYLIVGRPLNNMVSIYRPTNQALANSLDTASVNVNGNSATPLITNTGCRIIATISPNAAGYFVNGMVNAKVWLEDTVPTQSGNPFVARHYEITPATNFAFGGKVTLYFSQQEFNDFNAHAGSTLNLPTGDGDAVGKANLRIGKYSGISNNGTGLPGTYSGTPQVIDPIDTDIVWNSSLNRWEVSFDVIGFSGFVVQTSSPGLPLTLLEFSGHLVNSNAALNWKTTDELNTISFGIERSIDGNNYTAVGNVAAVNQPGIHNYYYIDNNIISLGVPVVYYRLKQKDIDGRFAYSRIVALPVDNRKSFVLFYPNPVIKEANLVITTNEPEQLQGRIMDNNGRVLSQQRWNVQSGSTYLPVNVSGLAKGMYYLELKGKKINEEIRFVKL